METVFVYGSLKKPEVQMQVLGHKVKGAPDYLDGCMKSHFPHGDHQTYPIILCPIEGQGVEGMTLEVTPEDLAKIDEYQKDIYKRQKVMLRSGTSAWTHVK